jgi:hypothetical protein
VLGEVARLQHEGELAPRLEVGRRVLDDAGDRLAPAQDPRLLDAGPGDVERRARGQRGGPEEKSEREACHGRKMRRGHRMRKRDLAGGVCFVLIGALHGMQTGRRDSGICARQVRGPDSAGGLRGRGGDRIPVRPGAIDASARGRLEAAAERRRASALADVLGNEVSARLGSLEAAKVNFGLVADEATESAFMASLDSVTARLSGLIGISLVYADGGSGAGAGTGLGQMISLEDTWCDAYLRALATRRPRRRMRWTGASAGASSCSTPSRSGHDTSVVAVLAAELDPQAIYRVASASGVLDTIRAVSSYQVVPDGWAASIASVRIADTAWHVECPIRRRTCGPTARSGSRRGWPGWPSPSPLA